MDAIKFVFVVFGFALLIAGILAIAPCVFLWSVNSLAEAGGSDFYIPHGVWTYIYSWGIIGLFASSSKVASK